MRNKLKLGLGVLLLGAGYFSASVQAEQAQPEAETQTETSDSLPSFLPKDYKVTDTLWGEWVFKMDTDHFDGQPEYPDLRFISGASSLYFAPSLFFTKWEVSHNVPFKFKTEGGGRLRRYKWFHLPR
ncbi:hypothetical protein FAI40_04595 [Acetobacteraceae bacterium]|nr:hypothetical protein FAI40_04595 [Acetobacteraceae bacterium]